MNQQNKLFASVSGICITTAVVVGAVLATANRDDQPRQQPAGNVGATAPAVVVTFTVTALPSPVEVAKVSPSIKKKPAAPKRQAVVQQGDPVTDPQPVDPTTSEPEQPAPVDRGPGTVDEGGIRRAPAPTAPHAPHPTDPKDAPPPLGPGAPSPSN